MNNKWIAEVQEIDHVRSLANGQWKDKVMDCEGSWSYTEPFKRRIKVGLTTILMDNQRMYKSEKHQREDLGRIILPRVEPSGKK